MNNEPQKLLSPEQHALVAEFTAAYGIEPEEITFFSGDPKPFFGYEATCTILNRLVDLRSAAIEPKTSPFENSLTLECQIQLNLGFWEGWKTFSAVGVADLNEDDGSGNPLSQQQIYQLAAARAIRSVLRLAGVDLVKLHKDKTGSQIQYTGEPKSNFAAMLAQAHILGTEAGLIYATYGDTIDKAAWYAALEHRYQVQHSNALTEDQLADFIGYLKGRVAEHKAQKRAA